MTKQNEFNAASPREEIMMEFLEHFACRSASAAMRSETIVDLLLAEGCFWKAHPLPVGVRRGEPKMCYRNATRLAWSRPGQLTYCEGYAFPSGLDCPIEHAWCVDHAGWVVDNTWNDSQGALYFGIPLALKFVSNVLARKQTFGVVFDGVSGRELLSTPVSLWRAKVHPLRHPKESSQPRCISSLAAAH